MNLMQVEMKKTPNLIRNDETFLHEKTKISLFKTFFTTILIMC